MYLLCKIGSYYTKFLLFIGSYKGFCDSVGRCSRVLPRAQRDCLCSQCGERTPQYSLAGPDYSSEYAWHTQLARNTCR